MSLEGVANTEYASLSGRIHTIVVDKTLTISGACADAKATGEAVKSLEDAFADIELMSPEGIEHAINERMDAVNSNINYLSEKVDEAAVAETYYAEVNDGAWGDESSGYYVAQVYVDGLLATDNPVVDVVLGGDMEANKLYKKQWGFIDYITTTDNYVNLYATDPPVCAFTMQLKVVR